MSKITPAVEGELGRDPVRRSAAERYRIRVDVGVIGESFQAQGSVRDISVTGARIEGVECAPDEGVEVRLGFSFHAQSLPVPIRGRVVRHTETGGFAVAFQDVDFRTQILLRALLPKVGDEAEHRIELVRPGHLDVKLSPALQGACEKLAETAGLPLPEWIVEQLERAAIAGLLEE